MDTKLPPIRSDIVSIPSVPRPTPTPVRVSFGDILAKGASTLVAGAQAAMDILPGGPLIAAAIRGAGGSSASTMMAGSFNGTTSPEGPTNMSVGGGMTGTASSSATAGGVNPGTIDQSLQQSQQMNLYFLQIQQEVNAQNEQFTTLSNVMKTEADTIKNAIGNLH